jgi:hypothetical protein
MPLYRCPGRFRRARRRLPIPKNSRWNGLVYLHGLLPAKPDDIALHRLVLISGDFGLAYLTERWAARFVSELFRNSMVCFIGYSINDPVLRYMMDALATGRMLGEITPQAWALGDCEPGQEHGKTIEWQAKGVSPILYEVPSGSHDHSALHKTLKAWAETLRDDLLGKERIVVSHSLARPSASTRQDDFVGRMLLALSDKSGLPTKRFADFNPVASLEWLLETFSQDRYRHGDLSRFDVPPRAEVDTKLRFSLVRCPAPYCLAPPMIAQPLCSHCHRRPHAGRSPSSSRPRPIPASPASGGRRRAHAEAASVLCPRGGNAGCRRLAGSRLCEGHGI